ncbi:hypothetical protein [Bacteroides sp. 224]|uniref:hypothetical protein n=1 Tax=Bacteroides sp. 224 TaxID=2302936 RepID=UPI0013CFE1DD|nr:hypothetical protein [Bacteroides sp. 224]NDV63990.1 hypothetical protein [Bacteroides sp. 224]
MKRNKKSKYTFETHFYAPELNKILLNGTNVNRYFPESIRRELTKDYVENLRKIRQHITFKPYLHFITIAYIGDKSGFVKEIQGGFNSWKEAMPVFNKMKEWFKTETPTRKVKFMY